ncbi:MAG: ABC transporter ATP-binding protein [Rhodobacteraceae bacterium]|jgi:oligopeptide/dipeptide ABC transporter ATP-binding protein|nr:ABC transporter ATP-binding protein [Paracoccaceae bacterium]
MTAPAPALSVEGLRVAVGPPGRGRAVVGDVAFAIPPGGRLAIVGESGSGKSMTALAVAGLLPRGARQTAGQIALGGRIVDPAGPGMARIRGREIAMIFQDPMSALNPVMTVGAQLVEAIRAHSAMSPRAARARAAEMLAAVQIPRPAERLDAWPHEFSGGMRQRVMIAMALTHRPKLLIADEPTTALDVTTQLQILRLIDGLCREEGSALMLITHDLGIVEGFCDSVVVLYGGRMMEAGPVAAVLGRPRHPYTRGLMATIPPLDRDVDWLDPIPGEPVATPAADAPGCPFAPRCGLAEARCRTVTPAWRPAGSKVAASCHLLAPSPAGGGLS